MPETPQEAFHASLQAALAAPGLVIPDGHHVALATSWGGPGTDVAAFLAVKVSDAWTVGASVAWHGGPPAVGVEVHGSW